LPNYRFIASYPRFFPDVRDGNGKSLEAKSGMVVSWDVPPSPAEWAETEEPVTWVADGEVPASLPAPEPVQEPFPNEPEPEAPVAVPEVPEEPTGPPEPEPVPEPSPEPEPVQPALTANWFSALGNPPARA
jgi:hypothetical protein